MSMKDLISKPRCFGSMTVNARGQVVIPSSARKELGINNGDTLLVFRGLPRQQGLLLIKAEAVEEMLGMLTEMISDLHQEVRGRAVKASRDKDGGQP
jgi:AbrB family looped-hinge helix DNA binding protein